MGWRKLYGRTALRGGIEALGNSPSGTMTLGTLNITSNATFAGPTAHTGQASFTGLNVSSLVGQAVTAQSYFVGGDKFRGIATIPVGSMYVAIPSVLVTASVAIFLTELTVTVSDQARRPAYVTSITSGVAFSATVNSATAGAQLVSWFIVQ